MRSAGDPFSFTWYLKYERYKIKSPIVFSGHPMSRSLVQRSPATMLCHFVWSIDLSNKMASAHVGLLHQPKKLHLCAQRGSSVFNYTKLFSKGIKIALLYTVALLQLQVWLHIYDEEVCLDNTAIKICKYFPKDPGNFYTKRMNIWNEIIETSLDTGRGFLHFVCNMRPRNNQKKAWNF